MRFKLANIFMQVGKNQRKQFFINYGGMFDF